MRSSGFGWRQLIKPLLSLVLPMAVMLLVLGLWATPMAARQSEQQLEQAFRSAAVWGLQAGKFHVLRSGELIIYAEAIEEEGTALRNIFIKQHEDGRDQVWVAQRGSYWMDQETGDRYLILEEGRVTDIAPGQLDLRILDFARNDLRLPEPEFRKRKKTTLDAKPSSDLLGEGNAESVAELQWRLSPAIMVVVLGLLAIPLAHSEPREGRGVRIILGILVYLLYGNMIYLCRSWVTDGHVPTYIGLWWVHLLFLAFSFTWIRRQGRFRTRLALK